MHIPYLADSGTSLAGVKFLCLSPIFPYQKLARYTGYSENWAFEDGGILGPFAIRTLLGAVVTAWLIFVQFHYVFRVGSVLFVSQTVTDTCLQQAESTKWAKN